MERMWPDALDTQELLEEARKGNAAARERLLVRHREALRRLIALRLDRAIAARLDASDVVQEVLIEADGRLAAYLDRPELPFHLWLRRIAMDRIVDAHRRHRRAQRRSVDREQRIAPAAGERSSVELALELRDGELTPAAAAMRRELARRFEAALAELSEEHREVVLLRHFEQLSNGDTARALGLSDAAAGMRYLRALRRLRAVLGDLDSEAASGGEGRG
jgi:RNA polymerase sigma-70 factor (ECF subfamily)